MKSLPLFIKIITIFFLLPECKQYGFRGVENRKKPLHSPEIAPEVCIKYNKQVFGFHNIKMTYGSAASFCKNVHNSELYNPKQEDLHILVESYKSWKKDDKIAKVFWTKWNLCHQSTDVLIWAIITAVSNTQKDGFNRKKNFCYIVTVNTTSVNKIPLSVNGDWEMLDFICTMKRSENCNEIINITTPPDVSSDPLVTEDYKCNNKVFKTKCPDRHSSCHNRECFVYDGTLFEFNQHEKQFNKSANSCGEIGMSGFELYKPSNFKEIKVITKYLNRIIVMKPYSFWIQNTPCNLPATFSFLLKVVCKVYVGLWDSSEAGKETQVTKELHKRRMTVQVLHGKVNLRDSNENMKHPYICSKKLDVQNSCLTTKHPELGSSSSTVPETDDAENSRNNISESTTVGTSFYRNSTITVTRNEIIQIDLNTETTTINNTNIRNETLDRDSNTTSTISIDVTDKNATIDTSSDGNSTTTVMRNETIDIDSNTETTTLNDTKSKNETVDVDSNTTSTISIGLTGENTTVDTSFDETSTITIMRNKTINIDSNTKIITLTDTKASENIDISSKAISTTTTRPIFKNETIDVDSDTESTIDVTDETDKTDEDTESVETDSENVETETIQVVTNSEDTTLSDEEVNNTLPGRTTKKECKQIEAHGIKWPRTQAGKKAFGRCPSRKYGKAEWVCNGRTGTFVGKPNIDCIDIDCSTPPSDKKYLDSYLAEKVIVCKDNPKENMERFMENIRKFREKARKKKPFGSSPQELIKEKESMEEIVSSALGAIDKLIEPDVKIWDRMEKQQKMKVSMNIIKETEETAWLMGCYDKESKLQQLNLAMQVIPLNKMNQIDFTLDDEGKQDFAILPKDIKPRMLKTCHGEEVSTAVAFSYKNIQKFLMPENGGNITSNIMGISLGNGNDTYLFHGGEDIRIRLNHPPKAPNAVAKCVYLNWNANKSARYGVWDTTGCETVTSEKGYTDCRCNHLTNFAILMEFSDSKLSETDDKILSLMSLVFSTLSSICLVLTIVVYIAVKSLRSRRNTFTCNLAACLLGMNVLVQTGLERVGTNRCLIISALLQYCVLSAFVWMLLEGALLYKMVILVFEKSNIRLPVCYGLAYGIPLIIVAMSSSIRPGQMIREKYCWPSVDKGMIWSVTGPMALIILVNIIIFAMTMNAAFRIDRVNFKQKLIREKKKNLVIRLKGMISLTCLLGFTWIVGFFYVPNNPAPTAYLFVTLNGLQGLFLFLTQIILNNHVRQKLFVIYKENMEKLAAATSTKNTILRSRKQKPQCKIPAEENTIIFSDVSPSNLYSSNTSIYPTAPSPEMSTSEASSYDEVWLARHPFEINYDK